MTTRLLVLLRTAAMWTLLTATILAADEPPLRVADAATRDLTEISLTELSEMKVTSVSRRPEERLTVPAAVHVVTQDDAASSGATTLPALLDLAPGVHVARVNSSQWAIGVRGFTSNLARDQLALIDGRSVYNPLF